MNNDLGAQDVRTGGFKRWLVAGLLSFTMAGAFLTASQSASAQVMVFDRGLPTANLNIAAGANRSNFLWADIETLPDTPFLPGDDFTLPAGSYTLTTIRVWTTTNVGLSLRGGPAGSPSTLLSNTFTATPVTYSNLQTYERTGGGFLPLFQVDFTVNIAAVGGVTYQFFVDGPAVPVLPAGDQEGVFLHASNAPLSGSTQQGANGILLWLDNANTVETWNALTGAGTYCGGACTGAADKVSDINVQVFGFVGAGAGAPGTATAVPTLSESTLIALALMMAGGGFLALRRRG
jgi:IPTL-CTERM motif